MSNIEEMIADAKAEEEVKREQEKAAKKKKAAEEFTKEFKAQLKNALADITPVDEQLVKITLNEYINLVYMARDLDILKKAISRSLELNYSGEHLRISNDEEIADNFKALYYEEYDEIINYLKELREKGE